MNCFNINIWLIGYENMADHNLNMAPRNSQIVSKNEMCVETRKTSESLGKHCTFCSRDTDWVWPSRLLKHRPFSILKTHCPGGGASTKVTMNILGKKGCQYINLFFVSKERKIHGKLSLHSHILTQTYEAPWSSDFGRTSTRVRWYFC